MRTDGIFAAILAFGDRTRALTRVLDVLETCEVDRIAIVANCVSEGTRTELLARKTQAPWRYLITESTENLGSAGGYAEACRICLEQTNCRWIWLLDDDNLPDADALPTLLSALDQLPPGSQPEALTCFRPSLPELNVPDIRLWRVPPHKGGCAGFHLCNLIDNIRPLPPLPEIGDEIPVFWSVYGGMLVPREIIETCGLPRRDFFLYCDDLEWTSRIGANGFGIKLVRNAIVRDLQPPWNASGEYNSNLARRIRELPAIRVYYELRNRNWLSLNRFAGPRWVYALNRFCYSALIFALCLRYRHMDRFRLMMRALRDAEDGRLGKTFEAGETA
jgi:GT2 family glycosyltransferase